MWVKREQIELLTKKKKKEFVCSVCFFFLLLIAFWGSRVYVKIYVWQLFEVPQCNPLASYISFRLFSFACILLFFNQYIDIMCLVCMLFYENCIISSQCTWFFFYFFWISLWCCMRSSCTAQLEFLITYIWSSLFVLFISMNRCCINALCFRSNYHLYMAVDSHQCICELWI